MLAISYRFCAGIVHVMISFLCLFYPFPVFKMAPVCDAECQWNKEQVRRKATIQRYCDARSTNTKLNWTEWLKDNSNRHRLRQILVSDKHRLIMCYIPKVACTNWKHLFFVLNGGGDLLKQHETNTIYVLHAKLTVTLQRMSRHLSQEEVIDRLENYDSLLVVRDPFTRALSAYQNKFRNANGAFTRRYREPIRSSSKNTNGVHRSNDAAVSWVEFVRYLGDPKFSWPTNEHWARMVDLCFPCQKAYGMIGLLDTMETDSRFTFNKLGLPAEELMDVVMNRGERFLPHDVTNSSDDKTARERFSSLSQGDIDDLVRTYADDFSAFGYNASEFKSAIPTS